MDAESQLTTVDNDETVLAVAREHLGDDPRIDIRCQDGEAILESFVDAQQFDLVFADAWPGKFTHLNNALDLLTIGGIYVIDDLLPQPSWPDGHASKAARLVVKLMARQELAVAELEWATGIIIATRLGISE